MTPATPLPPAAYLPLGPGRFQATELTRGPWNPDHQHAGPPIALLCRAIEQEAAADGLGHVARITANLLRPVPIAELQIELRRDYVGRNAGHFGASLLAEGKEVVRLTALVQREIELELPAGLDNQPGSMPPRVPALCEPGLMPFAGRQIGYGNLVENRMAAGRMFAGACQAWFRLQHPLVLGEATSPYQAVCVAADSGNGVSATLDYRQWLFVNSDLTINFLRRPQGDWVCLDARTQWGDHGGGLAESALWDSAGKVGRATQSLVLRPRA
ncbi:MAG: hypothetical protein RL722_1708 [Pseudomonadota bacterium]|jgi:hypothetical protein